MDNKERYNKAAHAMQSGVAFSKDKKEQDPKHLRVGINAVADAMEREANSYAERIKAETGANVTLS